MFINHDHSFDPNNCVIFVIIEQSYRVSQLDVVWALWWTGHRSRVLPCHCRYPPASPRPFIPQVAWKMDRGLLNCKTTDTLTLCGTPSCIIGKKWLVVSHWRLICCKVIKSFLGQLYYWFTGNFLLWTEKSRLRFHDSHKINHFIKSLTNSETFKSFDWKVVGYS